MCAKGEKLENTIFDTEYSSSDPENLLGVMRAVEYNKDWEGRSKNKGSRYDESLPSGVVNVSESQGAINGSIPTNGSEPSDDGWLTRTDHNTSKYVDEKPTEEFDAKTKEMIKEVEVEVEEGAEEKGGGFWDFFKGGGEIPGDKIR